MANVLKWDNSYKTISTKQNINYNFIIKSSILLAISVETEKERITYYFEPQGNQHKVNVQIFEVALKALLRCNSGGFDILCACFYGLKEQEEYFKIAIKVFKEHWNKLYNLAIANDVFNRPHSLENLDKTYDFFSEENESQVTN
ncbi:MAG: hypothetical protein IJ272_08745 [Clostridia bacterium]|nr:hypothetical protein [Clostridia bacterium]